MNNTVTKLIASIAILAASASFANAEGQNNNSEAVELPTYSVEGIDAMPSLTKRPLPRVSSDLVGSQITLKFTISAKGKPTGVESAKPLHSIQYPRDRDFTVEMINAVKHWRFDPARGTNGEAKALTVLMPIQVTERDDEAVVQASFKPIAAN